MDCVLVDFVSGRVIPGEMRFENFLWSRRFTKSVPLKLYQSNNDEDIIIFNKSFKFRYFSFVFLQPISASHFLRDTTNKKFNFQLEKKSHF